MSRPIAFAPFVAAVLAFGSLALAPAPGAAAEVDYSAQPRVLTTLSKPGTVLVDVVSASHWAWALDSAGKVQVVDLDDPSDPTFAPEIVPPAAAVDFALAGDLLYVLDASDRLRIYDVGVPDATVERGSVPFPGPGADLAIDGGHAYVASATAGLVVIDVSDPDAQAAVGSLPFTGDPKCVAVAAGYVYLATHDAGAWDAYSEVFAIDVSDPTAPVALGSDTTPGIFSIGADLFEHLVPVGNELYADHYWNRYDFGTETSSSGWSVWRIDLSDPTDPDIVQQILESGDDSGVLARDGTRAFWVRQKSGPGGICSWEDPSLLEYDVADPAAPVLESRIALPDLPIAVATAGDLVLAVDQSGGLTVVDASGAGSVPWKPAAYGAYGIAFDHHFFTLDFISGAEYPGGIDWTYFRMYDVQDPSNPTSLPTSSAIWVNLEGAMAVLDAGTDVYFYASGGDELVRHTWGTLPAYVGPVNGPHSAPVVHAGFLYGGTSPGTFGVFDLATPESPTTRGSVFVGSPSVDDVAISEGRATLTAWVVAGLAEVVEIDVTNPDAPAIVDSHPTPVPVISVDFADGVVWAGGEDGTLIALDPAPPSLGRTGTILGTLPLSAAWDVRVDGDRAYVAAGEGGLAVVDVSDPTALRYVGGADFSDVRGVHVGTTFVGVTQPCRQGNILSLDGSPPVAAPVIGAPPASPALAIRPNPGRGAEPSRVDFALERERRVKLAVYDVAGRLVATLADRRLPAGAHSIAWNGRSRAGAPVAAGIYFVRLEAEGRGGSKQVVRIR